MVEKFYITADILFDGRKDIFKDAVIEVTGDKITKVSQSEEIQIPNDVTVFNTPFLMPGLWDCHVHLFGGLTLDMIKMMEEPPGVRVLRTTVCVRNLLEAGFTSIRDVGGPIALRLKRVINEGTLPGPHIYAAHRFLSQTAGHGDNHPTPLSWQSSAHADWYARLADGVPECRKATREQIREGADLIKVFVTGGVVSHIDSPHQAHYSMNELRAIIEEAKRFDLPTSAHAHGLQGIKNALSAGIDTIEHGTFLDAEVAEEMVKKGVILVPTFRVLRVLLEQGEKSDIPLPFLDKAKEVYKIHQKSIKMAIKKGVQIAAGCDLLGVLGYQHGHDNTLELAHLQEAGLKPMQALQAATSMGPKTLGPRAPDTGEIAPGKDADILCLDKNPLNDLTILKEKDYKLLVFKKGELVVKNGKIL